MSRGLQSARLLARGWWIVAGAVFLSVTGAAFFSSRQPVLYRSSSTLLVMPDSSIVDTSEVMRALETLERRTVVATLARLPVTSTMRSLTEDRLDLPAGAIRGYRIQSSVVPNTNMIRIEVEGPDGERVAEIARELSDLTEVEARRMYRIFSMEVVEEAVASRAPVAPRPRRTYAVAIVMSLVLGIGTVYASRSLRETSATLD